MSERPPQNREERRAAKKAENFRLARERGQVTPDELEKGVVYSIPSHGGVRYLIVSVGPKWITWKQEGLNGWQRRTRVLKSGWNGPYFLKENA